MHNTPAACPNCNVPVEVPLRAYWGPFPREGHVRCPACATWLLISTRARLLGAAVMFTIVAGTCLTLNVLGAPLWPRWTAWIVVSVVTAFGMYLGLRVVRSQASWEVSENGG